MDPLGWLPPGERDRIAREERAEEAAFERDRAARADEAEAKMQMYLHGERLFQYSRGYSRAELMAHQSALADAADGRDGSAPWGSAARPAVRIGDTDLRPREEATGPVTQRADSIPARLARARQNVKGREFMAGLIADLDRRRGAGRHHISRTEDGVTCWECIAAGCSPEESFLLHHDPEDPLPETPLPDHAPSRSAPGVLTSSTEIVR